MKFRLHAFNATGSLMLNGIAVYDGDSDIGDSVEFESNITPDSGILASAAEWGTSESCIFGLRALQASGFFIEIQLDPEQTATEILLRGDFEKVFSLKVSIVDDGGAVVAVAQVFNTSATFDGEWRIRLVDEYQEYVLSLGATYHYPFSEVTGSALSVVSEHALSVRSTATRKFIISNNLTSIADTNLSTTTPLVQSSSNTFGALNAGSSIVFIVMGWSERPGDAWPSEYESNQIVSKQRIGASWPSYTLSQGKNLTLTVFGGNSNAEMLFSEGVDFNLLDGLPHHVALCRSANDYSVYVDGVRIIHHVSASSPYSDAGFFALCGGAMLPGPGLNARDFVGAVGPLSIFDRCLNGVEVEGLAVKAGTFNLRKRPRVTRRTFDLSQAVFGTPAVPQGLMAGFKLTAKTFDTEHAGPGTIHGTVEQKLSGDTTLPLKRRVRLHRSRDGLLVRETWSDAQGNYRFDGLSTRYEYDVIAWDHEGQFRSTIANNLKPEVLS